MTRTSSSLLGLGLVALFGGCLGILGDFSVSEGGTSSDGGPEAGSFTVTPNPARVGILRKLAFTTSVPATFSVEEGESGGTVDDKGVYLSPITPGTYHLIVARVDKPEDKQRIEVQVVDLELVALAGGGASGRGSLDGPIDQARLGGQEAIDFDPVAGILYIADTANHTIRVAEGFNAGSPVVRTVAGLAGQSGNVNGQGATARFASPHGIVGFRGIAYVTDENHCIRTVDIKTGAVKLFSGTCGTPGTQDGSAATALFGDLAQLTLFPSPSAPVGTPPKTLLVCEHGAADRVRAVDMVTGAVTPWWNSGGPCSVGTVGFHGGAWDQFLFTSGGPFLGEMYAPGGLSVTYPLPFSQATGFAHYTGFGGGNQAYVASENSIFEVNFASLVSSKNFAGVVGESKYMDGPVADARFRRIRGMASDPSHGQIFVSDTGSNTVRRIEGLGGPTVVSKTMVGKFSPRLRKDGDGDRALFCAPTSIVLDGKGFAYVSDANADSDGDCNVIRKVDLTTRKVTTLSGKHSTQAEAKRVDGSGADAGYIFPFDLAIVGDAMYVIEISSNAIRKISLANGAVEAFVGEAATVGNIDGVGAAARFSQPASFASDGAGKLYVTDNANFAVRVIDVASKTVGTVAGGTKGTVDGIGKAAQFISPIGIAHDGAGHLFVADSEDHTIRQIDIASGQVTTFMGVHGDGKLVDGDKATARLRSPIRLAYDGVGGLLVTEGGLGDQDGGVIRRIDIKRQTLSTFFGKASERGFRPRPRNEARVNGIVGITPDPVSGDLFVTDYADAVIGRIKPL